MSTLDSNGKAGNTGEKPTKAYKLWDSNIIIMKVHSASESDREIGSCGDWKVCALYTSELHFFKGGKKKLRFLCEIAKFLNIVFNTLCRLNETYPIPPICSICHTTLCWPYMHSIYPIFFIKIWWLKLFNFLIVTYRALSHNSKPKIGFFSLPLFQVTTKMKESKKELTEDTTWCKPSENLGFNSKKN